MAQLRLIAGSLRGRKIYFTPTEQLRPITDRAREDLFNWINFELTESNVLDAFAGSGCLGFEALSRGVKHCTFVEKSFKACQQIKTHASDFVLLNQVQVIQADITAWLKKPSTLHSRTFDWVFFDPPFLPLKQHKNLTLPLASLIELGLVNGHFTLKSRWVIKFPHAFHKDLQISFSKSGLVCQKHKVIGQSSLSIWAFE